MSAQAQYDTRNDSVLKHFASRSQQNRNSTQNTHLPGNARINHDPRVPPPSRVHQPTYEYGVQADHFVPFSTISRQAQSNARHADAMNRKTKSHYMMGDGDGFTSQGPRY